MSHGTSVWLTTVALCAIAVLAGCDEAPSKPSESYTYNAYIYYGEGLGEQKYLGQVIGISRCQTAVHSAAAEMKLKGHSYSYACCWVNEGQRCYEKHK